MKVYVSGNDPSIRVPRRAIALTDGTVHTVYDTSGPYTDSESVTDIRCGLRALREPWIAARGDTLELQRPSSLYRRGRDAMPELDELRFPAPRRPKRAKPGANVTQMHYAKRGEITRRDGVRRTAGKRRAGVRPRRNRSRASDPSVQRQSSRERADDHRPQLPREDQREHRQLRGELLDRRGGREDDLGDALGRRYRNGPLDREEHSRDARVDSAQLAGADRYRSDLSGARKGRRQGRRADVGAFCAIR